MTTAATIARAFPRSGALAVLLLGACGSGAPSQDSCVRVPLAHVNALCGTTTTMTTAFDEPGAPSGIDYDSVACFYDGPQAAGPEVRALRFSFHAGASAAQARLDQDRSALVGTITDVSGIGDAGFYLEDLPTTSAEIHVVEAADYVTVQHLVVSAQNATLVRQCLTTLATEVLAI
jgi:hypothetical protein